jgi:SAM-dependent methyltransferase
MDVDAIPTELPFAEACERNKGPILEQLVQLLPECGRVLEIGSGTGQHVVHFAPHFARLSWQPTERREHLPGLNARIRREGNASVLPAIELDVEGIWPDHAFAAAFSANTAHIMPWRGVCAMFAALGPRLRAGAPFCLYGPFNVDGAYTSPGNRDFDQQLREQDPDMGLRDAEAVEGLAAQHRLRSERRIGLPANNMLLVFRRHEE